MIKSEIILTISIFHWLWSWTEMWNWSKRWYWNITMRLTILRIWSIVIPSVGLLSKGLIYSVNFNFGTHNINYLCTDWLHQKQLIHVIFMLQHRISSMTKILAVCVVQISCVIFTCLLLGSFGHLSGLTAHLSLNLWRFLNASWTTCHFAWRCSAARLYCLCISALISQ